MTDKIQQHKLTIGLVSISDRASTGVYQDAGLPALQDWFSHALSSPWRAITRLIPDEQAIIEANLIELAYSQFVLLYFVSHA